jgi:hypothetical protein
MAGKRVARWVARPWVLSSFLGACTVGMIGHFGFGCSGWDPRRPFERNSVEVDRAIEMIEAGEYSSAQEVLTDYLGAGPCKEGEIALPDSARKKPDGTFDLGIVLFHLAEKYGRKFGDEDQADPENPDDLETVAKRALQVRCGLIASLAIAGDTNVPVELRARAYYLAGNMEFLRGRYAEALRYYAESLKLVPGVPEEAGGDGIGRDVAWNRAVALRRLEKEQDGGGAGEEPQPEPQPQPGDDPQDPRGPENQDGGGEGDQDAGNDAGDKDSKDPAEEGPDGGEDAGPDAGGNQGQEPDAGDQDDPSQQDPQNGDPQPAEPKGPGAEQGDRVLDQFEQVPTYQQEEAKKKSEGRQRNMEDK